MIQMFTEPLRKSIRDFHLDQLREQWMHSSLMPFSTWGLQEFWTTPIWCLKVRVLFPIYGNFRENQVFKPVKPSDFGAPWFQTHPAF